jgi:hypothetical protein
VTRHESVLRPVERYYTGKIEEHGPTPSGVDWNSAESQQLRFDQLLGVVEGDRPFSLNDYGCGYGALVDALAARHSDFSYCGFDVSRAQLESAIDAQRGDERCRFVGRDEELNQADYTVASGIFNVKLRADDDAWRDYAIETIARLAELSTRGFAFNMLTSYSDPEFMREDLFYADPLFFFDHCKREHSRQVALLHDYGLYEFTIIVRRDPGESR